MKNNTRNEIEERAISFLNRLDINDLKKLIYSNNLDWFPDDHITKKFVDYVYGDNKQTLGFTMCLMSLYPYIAQEMYNRYSELIWSI